MSEANRPPNRPKSDDEWESLILKFIGSLCLADHLGDVGEDVQEVLKQIGHEPEWDDFSDLMKWLHKRGVTTLHGTTLGDEEEESEQD